MTIQTSNVMYDNLVEWEFMLEMIQLHPDVNMDVFDKLQEVINRMSDTRGCILTI